MTQNVALAAGNRAVTPFFTAIQELLGAGAPAFRLLVLNDTTIRCVAGTVNDQQTIAVQGKYRFRTTNADAAHPGGAAGTHSVYVTASDNSYSGTPTVDATVYDFGLTILTSGTPGTALYRKVGEVDWDGTKITALRMWTGTRYDGDPGFHIAPTAAHVPLKVRGAASQSGALAEFQSNTGTVLASISAAGGATFSALINAASAGISINGEVIDRPGAGVVRVSSALRVTGDLDHDGTNVGFYGTAPIAKQAAYSVLTESGPVAPSELRALTTNWTMQDLMRVVFTLYKDLQRLGLLT